MSYFYLKPIHGNVSLHTLEECVIQRWKYFLCEQSFTGEASSNTCQYLIEGSVYDNIGHFTLNYLSLCSHNLQLIQTVLASEEELFYKRLTIGTTNNLRLLCKYILKFTKQISNNEMPYTEILENICKKLVLKPIANHILNKEHSHQCFSYTVQCHFTLCLSLVKKRCVEINNGKATIPCGRWIIFLKHIFREHLQHRNNGMSKDSIVNVDPRCREIILKLTQSMSANCEGKSVIEYKQLDNKVKYFPLCMKTLHNSLRNKHRLSHNERFRYSLFLKDIGVPVQESIYFWQQEYSKPSLHHSTCFHSWQKDSKKYIYGIRHLYGLEGSRKNYSMVKCTVIQKYASNEGGCPFKHFNKHRLQHLMDSNVLTESKLKEINYFVDNRKCIEACTAYRNAVLHHISSNSTADGTKMSSYVFSPVDYFKHLHSTNILEYEI